MILYKVNNLIKKLKEQELLNYDWVRQYGGSLIIKNPSEDEYHIKQQLFDLLSDNNDFSGLHFNTFCPTEFKDIIFIIIHKNDIDSNQICIDVKEKFKKEFNDDFIVGVDNWIKQFPYYNWKMYALKLLSNTIYLNDAQIIEKLKEVVKYIGTKNFVVSEIEGLEKSSVHLFYYFNKISDIPTENFILSENLKSTDKRDIVFIDDIIGTGSQAIGHITKLKKEGKIGDQKLHYYAIVGLDIGIKKLKDSNLFECVEVTMPIKKAFDSTGTFSNEEIGQAKKMAETIGRQLSKNMPLGYNNSEALVFFSHNSPNNSLPIFWADGKCKILEQQDEQTKVKWTPLFPRKRKPKSGDFTSKKSKHKQHTKTHLDDHKKIDRLIEKDDEMEIFNQFINRETQKNTICIHGFGGTGKTTLLEQFATRAKEQKMKVIHGSMKGQTLSSFFIMHNEGLALSENNVFLLFDYLLKTIEEYTVFFIDDYPETHEYDELANWLIDEVKRRNSKVLFVLASRKKPNFKVTSPVIDMKLRGMSLSECRKYIKRSAELRPSWVNETVEYMEDIHIRASCDVKYFNKSRSNPKIVELLCTNQNAWNYFKQHQDIQLSTIELYGQIWENLEAATREAVKLFATCVQVSPDIHGGTIRDLINEGEFELKNLLDRSILTEIGNDKFSLHDTFKDFVYDKCLGDDERLKHHQELALYYTKQRNFEYVFIHYMKAEDLHGIIKFYNRGMNAMEGVSNINTISGYERTILSLIDDNDDGIEDIITFKCDVLMNLAEHKRILSDYKDSILYFNKVRGLAQIDNEKLLPVCNIGMGDVYRRMGKYELALERYQDAHNMCLADNIKEQAQAYTGLGAAYNMLCNYSDALEFHLMATNLYLDINDKRGVARNLRGQAASLNLLGKYSDALNKYTSAKKIYESDIDDERGRAYALWGSGESCRMIGKYSDALDYFKEAIDVVRAIGDLWAEIYINLNLGELYRAKGDFNLAKESFGIAIEFAKMKMFHVECAYGQLGLLETKRLEGIFEYESYDKVISIFKKNSSCWGVVHGSIGKALACLNQDNNLFHDVIAGAKEICQENKMSRETKIIENIKSESKSDFLHPMNYP